MSSFCLISRKAIVGMSPKLNLKSGLWLTQAEEIITFCSRKLVDFKMKVGNKCLNEMTKRHHDQH